MGSAGLVGEDVELPTSEAAFACAKTIPWYCRPCAARASPCRFLRLSLYGLLLDGPVGHTWYRLLDERVHPEAPASDRAVLLKTTADQVFWAPAMTIVFLAFVKALELHPELILPTIQVLQLPRQH